MGKEGKDMKIKIEFNKPLDEQVLSQFDPELLKKEFEIVHQLQNEITLQGEFTVGFIALNLWIESTKDKDVYCVFSMTDVKFFIIKEEGKRI